MQDTPNTTVIAPEVKHYVVWYGPIESDIFDCPVADRDPAHYTLDEAADYFRFYDRLEMDWEVDGVTHRLRSEQFNFSAFYVPEGKLLEGAEREAAFRGSLSWASHQEEIYHAVKTRYRNATVIPRGIGEVVTIP